MFQRKNSLLIRKIHRYLGIFLGIQFMMWTVGGLYFSWTNLDEIHGDHLKQKPIEDIYFHNLISPNDLINKDSNKIIIKNIALKIIIKEPYYWINDQNLYHAQTGILKKEITQKEALSIAKEHIISHLEVDKIERITKVGKHHEYRKKDLPAYVISYKGQQKVKAYINLKNGDFQTVRHRSWRWFDFLWMLHTMDYQGRDDFNNMLLRVFSLMGIFTVLSGFVLAFITSKRLMSIFK